MHQDLSPPNPLWNNIANASVGNVSYSLDFTSCLCPSRFPYPSAGGNCPAYSLWCCLSAAAASLAPHKTRAGLSDTCTMTIQYRYHRSLRDNHTAITNTPLKSFYIDLLLLSLNQIFVNDAQLICSPSRIYHSEMFEAISRTQHSNAVFYPLTHCNFVLFPLTIWRHLTHPVLCHIP